MIQITRWHRCWRTTFAGLMLVLTVAGLAAPATVGAQSAGDVRSVTSAVTEWSRTWEQGELFALYDQMLPEARNAFPRQAFLLWAESPEVATPLDDPEVLDVAVELAGESPVSGETYRKAAVVTYRQEVLLNGETVSQDATETFVREGVRWRWMPMLDADTVPRFMEDAATLDDARGDDSGFSRAAYVRIDRFWNAVFAAAGQDYQSPEAIVAVVEQPLETGCGVETEIEEVGIYYCVLDESVYYDPEFREVVVDVSGSYGFTMVIAHEWGHHIQSLLGIAATANPDVDGGLYPIDIELQADCLAGIYTQDALANGLIDDDDVDAAVAIARASGDRPSTEWDDRDAHGTGSQRVQSFLSGFEDGFAGCSVDLSYAGDANFAIRG